jgi:MFS family permease
VFCVNVPVGIFGTVWAYRSLRETSERHRGRIDWWGNLTFAGGAGALLVAITYGIQPYGGHTMGWSSPKVLVGLIGGVLLLVIFGLIEARSMHPMFRLGLFRISAFAAGSAANLLAAIARGGLQFMLIIWLQGIWLPLHGYNYSDTPLYAGIFLLPLTLGFLIAGPTSGILSDRYGARAFATGGLLVFGSSFVGLLLMPINFPYWAFALLIMLNGIGSGIFSAPNTSSMMSSVPANERGAASGMRATFQNAGTSLSIGIFFSLLIIGLSSTLPRTLTAGLERQGVPSGVAQQVGSLPPVSSVFSAFLGVNPIQTLLKPSGVLNTLPANNVHVLTGRQFFPNLISAPFHHGLIIVFAVAAVMGFIAAASSLIRTKERDPQ